MGQIISIGKQDFSSLRENHYFYIDKTDFIRQWWENADDITLITRPRRFGKTLNMSMLKYYFDCTKKDSKELFEGLKIMEQDEKYTSNQIITTLREYKHLKIEGAGYIPEFERNEITDDLQKIFKLNLDKEIITPATMRAIIKKTKEISK